MTRYCPNCGTQVSGDTRFCPSCGAAMGGAQQPGAGAAGGLEPNVAGLLCYILGFITGILFLVLEPYNRDKFIRFHAFQSIFFNLALFVIAIAFSIIAFIPFIGWIFSLLSLFLWIGFFILWLFLMYKAYNNERYKLPIIGDLAEKQA